MKIKKQTIAKFLVFCVLLTFTFFQQNVIASSNTKYGVVNEKNGVKVRGSASNNGSLIKTLKKDARVEIVVAKGNWYKIDLGSTYGYVPMSSITMEDEDEENTTSKSGTVDEKNGVKVRKSASSSGTLIKTLSDNTTVDIVATKGNWYKIDLGSKYGYVPMSSITIEDEDTTSKSGTVDEKSGVKVRKSASSSGTLIKTLSDNTTVDIVATKGSWYKIDLGSKYGYVLKNSIKITNDKRTDRGTINRKSGVSVKTKPNGSKTLTTLEYKDRVDIYDKESKCYKIKIKNQYGYVPVGYIDID